jgi:predicted aspartyl protease
MRRAAALLTLLTTAPPLAPAQTAVPAAAPHDFTMPAGGRVTVSAENGLVFDISINGQGPFHALFDTGSDNLLTAPFARRLGLHLSSDSQPFDGGSAVISAQTTTIPKLQIGDLVLRNQSFYVISPAAEVPDDAPTVVLGYETLRQLVVTIDPDNNAITFTDGAAFHPPARAVRVPLILNGHALLADGAVNGISARFVLDTGNEFCFELDDDFVRPSHLVEATGAHYRGYAGSSYGGDYSDALVARVDSVRLGGAEVHSIITDLATTNPTGGGIAGNVGQSILLQFRSTWDVIRGALYLERGQRPHTPEIFNRAGLITEPEAHGQRIRTVFPNSPGDQAGLAANDLITIINGAPITNDFVIPAFLQRPGTVVHLIVLRGDQTRSVDVTLRDIL